MPIPALTRRRFGAGMGLGATSAMLLAACGESESEATTVAATPAPATAAPATAPPTAMASTGDAMPPRQNAEIRFVTDHIAGPRGAAKSPGAAVPRATAPTTSRTW